MLIKNNINNKTQQKILCKFQRAKAENTNGHNVMVRPFQQIIYQRFLEMLRATKDFYLTKSALHRLHAMRSISVKG